jgi:hypothetical protein
MNWTQVMFWAFLIAGAACIWWGTRKRRRYFRDSYDWRNDGRWRQWM